MTIKVETEAGPFAPAIEKRLESWSRTSFGKRLWAADPTLWSTEPLDELEDRLGWLDLPRRMPAIIEDLSHFGAELREQSFDQVVVLGMGGSSLAPGVFAAMLGGSAGSLPLTVLDSTHPAAVRGVAEQVDPASTLFVVSSKSGTTIETLSFFHYFWEEVSKVTSPGPHFAAVTDEGSPLDALAGRLGFRRVFHAPSNVGGRYSALSEFGLVPAAAIGSDLDGLHHGAAHAAEICGPEVGVASNAGLQLGAFLGELAVAGRDKATFLATDRLRAIVPWIEQLLAESTGKGGTGIVPVGGDEDCTTFGADRALVVLDTLDDRLRAPKGDAPVARLRIDDETGVGGAMFVLEVATAAAGAILEIHPFNQPDVQLAKDLARGAMKGDLDGDPVEELDALDPDLTAEISSWLSRAEPGNYIAIQAFLPPSDAVAAAMETARRLISTRLGMATTFAFGPRFLHSTGQLHKGGPPVLCLQVIDHPHPHLAVPGTDYGFEALIRAQALGDYRALRDRGRDVLLVCLGDSGAEGLSALVEAVAAAGHR